MAIVSAAPMRNEIYISDIAAHEGREVTLRQRTRVLDGTEIRARGRS